MATDLTKLQTPMAIGGSGFSLVTSVSDAVSEVFVWLSNDGATWAPGVDIGQRSKFAPSLAVFNGKLYLAWVSDDSSDTLAVCSSADGTTWSGADDIGQQSQFGPSLAVFNGRLYVVFIGTQSSNRVLVCSSADGATWSANVDIGQSGKFAPSLAVFDGKLYVAFIANNKYNNVLVCSYDGTTWSAGVDTGQTSQFAPSLAVFNGKLYVAFVDYNSNEVLVCSSADGAIWSAAVDSKQSSQFAPSLVAFDGRLYLAIVDTSDVAWVGSSQDAVSWSSFNGISSTIAGAALTSTRILQGSVYPTYQVLSVLYAPPGTSGTGESVVKYSSGSSTGTKTTVGTNFKAGVSVSIDASLEAGPVELGAGGHFAASKATADSDSLDVEKSTAYEIDLTGPSADGIDHDHDVFVLWLNPSLPVSVDLENNVVTWGIGVDGDEMLIEYVYAGWLSDPKKMPAGVQKQLAKAGLTSADYENILKLDPFATDADTPLDPRRFLLTPQSIPYDPPLNKEDPPTSTTYTQTSESSSTSSEEVEDDYEVGISLSAGIDVGVFKATLKTEGTMDWSNTSGVEADNASTESASVTIGGPAYGYSGPTDILVYWDTMYRSFFFAFVPDGAAAVTGAVEDETGDRIASCPVTLTLDGKSFKTLTNSEGEYRLYGVPNGTGELEVALEKRTVDVEAGSKLPVVRITQ